MFPIVIIKNTLEYNLCVHNYFVMKCCTAHLSRGERWQTPVVTEGEGHVNSEVA